MLLGQMSIANPQILKRAQPCRLGFTFDWLHLTKNGLFFVRPVPARYHEGIEQMHITRACAHACTCACTHVDICIHTHVRMLRKCICRQTQFTCLCAMYTDIHVHIYTHSCTHFYSSMCTCMHMYACWFSCFCSGLHGSIQKIVPAGQNLLGVMRAVKASSLWHSKQQ